MNDREILLRSMLKVYKNKLIANNKSMVEISDHNKVLQQQNKVLTFIIILLLLGILSLAI